MEPINRVLDGRYEISRKLGEGGMGQVYGGRDLLKNRPVAVKLLAEEVASDATVRDRFRREANVLHELEHPSLVKLLDAKVDGREPFLVFEFVEGERLDRVIAGTPMEVRRALVLAAQIASALAALHARGVVHRDVKPSNIMLRGDGTLCLLDFGTAKHAGSAERTAEQLTTEGFVVGTLQYMPPEALFSSAPLAPNYDVWSLGIVLWEMLVGRRPFADVELLGMTAFMDALRACQLPPLQEVLPSVPSAAAGLVRAMIDPRAGGRPADGSAALESIVRVQEQLDAGQTSVGLSTAPHISRKHQRPTPALGYQRPTGNTLVLRREAKGGRGRWLAALALAVPVAIGAALVWWPQPRHGAGPSAPAPDPHLANVIALARTCQKDAFPLMSALKDAGGHVAPDAGRSALEAMLRARGVTDAQLHSLALAERKLAELDPTSSQAATIAEPLFALEFIEQMAGAVELPASFRLGVSAAIPPGFQQRVVPSPVDGERRTLALTADGSGANAVLRFQVADPASVSALWLSVSGDALRSGHVVGMKLNDHAVSMGGLDPQSRPGEPRELRRGLPARFLKAGENRLDARVLGAPPGAPHDSDGLHVTLRVSSS